MKRPSSEEYHISTTRLRAAEKAEDKAANAVTNIIQHIRRTVLARDEASQTDGQLLGCFVEQRDEAAFEALVRRHGSMVFGVCRRLLHNQHDAEDAFQATFLVLVRKASSVVPRELVANWLYGVAHQTAIRARSVNARRCSRERQGVVLPEPEAVWRDCWDDLQPLLDQELSCLPDKYRVPIVLCDLEGKTRKETARQLGLPEGTVSSRLARARTMLAKRLARHGLAVSGGSLAAVLSQKASACVPAAVVSGTIKAASLLAAGQPAVAGLISAKVAALTDGVLKAMLWTKVKAATFVLLAVGLVGVGAGISFDPSWLGGPAVTAEEGATSPALKAKEVRSTMRSTTLSLSSLIQQLGDPEFAQRERASKTLCEIGQPAVEALRKAADASEDAEVQRRCNDLIDSIESPSYGEVRRFEGHTALVYSVAFSSTKHQILTSSYDKTLRLWDWKSGKELQQITAHEVEYGTLCAALAPDGRHALSGSADGSVRLWNLETGKELKKFLKQDNNVLRVSFSCEGQYALSAQDKTARLWDLKAGRQETCFEGHTEALWEAVFSPDDKRVLTASVDHTLRLWDRKTSKELHRIVVPTVVNTCVAYSPDGSRFASGGSDNLVHLWDAEAGTAERTLTGHTAPITAIAFSPDGRRVLSGSHDRTVRLWDVITGTELRRFRGHTNMVYAVAISPDGTLALSGSEDRMARLWRLPAKDAPIVQLDAGEGEKPREAKKRGRVPDPSPELRMELFQLDAKYRHGSTEQFAELEAKAEALAKRHPAKDDQARIWYAVAHVGGQSGIDKHRDLVRKYASKCLEVSRDPLQRGRMYSHLASTVDLSGTAFPKGRREAAGILLKGYREVLAQELPQKVPELPGVEKIGDLLGEGGPEEAQALARHAVQVAAREEAKFVRDQIEVRETLLLQLRDLYKPDVRRHGHNEEGPQELRVLSSKWLTDQQVSELIKKIVE